MRSRAVQFDPQAGLTLMEVMIALTILAFMMAMAWTTTSSSLDAKQRSEIHQERNHELRVAMNIMVRDFSSAYLSRNEDMNLDDRRSMFIAKDSSPVGEVRFSSLGHRVIWSNANESEQTLISYEAISDRKDPTKTNLTRRELRRLSNEDWENEPAEVDILLRDIERVEFEYFDWRDGDWQDGWNTINADAEKDRLPERVRIVVTVKDSEGKDYKRTTTARITMMEQLSF